MGVVVLDDPQPVHYAGMTSAKIFKRIAERIATMQNLPTSPEYAAKQTKQAPVKIRVPELQGHTLSTVEDLLDTLNLDIAFVNTGDIISRQIPAAGTAAGRWRTADSLSRRSRHDLQQPAQRTGRSVAALGGSQADGMGLRCGNSRIRFCEKHRTARARLGGSPRARVACKSSVEWIRQNS